LFSLRVNHYPSLTWFNYFIYGYFCGVRIEYTKLKADQKTSTMIVMNRLTLYGGKRSVLVRLYLLLLLDEVAVLLSPKSYLCDYPSIRDYCSFDSEAASTIASHTARR
jgi:hypothetical protein